MALSYELQAAITSLEELNARLDAMTAAGRPPWSAIAALEATRVRVRTDIARLNAASGGSERSEFDPPTPEELRDGILALTDDLVSVAKEAIAERIKARRPRLPAGVNDAEYWRDRLRTALGKHDDEGDE
jgi:hypothetical protein